MQVSRSLAWKRRKKASGLCQWCGRNKARILSRTQVVKKVVKKYRGALCEECEQKRKKSC